MPGGRPPKYKTEHELELKVDEYFQMCKEDKDINPTISGLAYHLGYETRQSIYDLEKGKFSYIIKRAVSRIESLHENGLYSHSNAGHIFWLKNRGWTDKQDVNVSGELSHKVIEWKPAK